VMPADFVYYDHNGCRKLLMIYQYAYRVFEPTDNLAEAGSDYGKHPLHVVDWMYFLIKAVLFYDKRFYFFTLANRVLIEEYPMDRECTGEKILQVVGPVVEHLASEFILQSVRNLNSQPGGLNQTSGPLPKYQLDPYRVLLSAKKPRGKKKIEEYTFVPPLNSRIELPEEYAIGHKSARDNMMRYYIIAAFVVTSLIVLAVVYCRYRRPVQRIRASRRAGLQGSSQRSVESPGEGSVRGDQKSNRSIASPPQLSTSKATGSNLSEVGKRSPKSKGKTPSESPPDSSAPDAKTLSGKMKSGRSPKTPRRLAKSKKLPQNKTP